MTPPKTFIEEELRRFEKGYIKALLSNKYSDKEEYDPHEDGAAHDWSIKFLSQSHLRLLKRVEAEIVKMGVEYIAEYEGFKAGQFNGLCKARDAITKVIKEYDTITSITEEYEQQSNKQRNGHSNKPSKRRIEEDLRQNQGDRFHQGNLDRL